jgi:hypothetical protein
MSSSLGRACDREACIKGKHARLPSHPVTERATERLDLVYADICGPFPESLMERVGICSYSSTMLPDTLGAISLEHKSDAEARFRNWEAEMQTQYSLQAKRFRTDGGGEFTSKELFRDGPKSNNQTSSSI